MENTVLFEAPLTFSVPCDLVDRHLNAPEAELRLILLLLRNTNTAFLKEDLRPLVNSKMKADTIHPVFTTMMPKSLGMEGMGQILDEFCRIKNEDYDGEAGLQLSINSTDEEQRRELFRGLSMRLEDISYVCRQLPMPKGRKYTLNFPVTDKTILDPKELSRLFDKEKFIVKITPIHETNEANANGIGTPEGYYKYDVYRQFEQPLLAEGWQVIVFIPSKEEDEDRITCGNALLSIEPSTATPTET